MPTLSFSLASSQLPHPELSDNVLDSIQRGLYELCQSDDAGHRHQ